MIKVSSGCLGRAVEEHQELLRALQHRTHSAAFVGAKMQSSPGQNAVE